MSIAETIRNEVARVLGIAPETLADDQPLAAQKLDSVRVMDVVGFLEDEFEIDITDLEIASFQTLNDIISHVKEKID